MLSALLISTGNLRDESLLLTLRGQHKNCASISVVPSGSQNPPNQQPLQQPSLQKRQNSLASFPRSNISHPAGVVIGTSQELIDSTIPSLSQCEGRNTPSGETLDDPAAGIPSAKARGKMKAIDVEEL